MYHTTENATPVIILSCPQLGENIGACARVMCNFGLTDLRLINPRDGWPNAKAYDTAKAAAPILDQVQIYETLTDSLHDIYYLYATTTRPRDMVKPVLSPKATIQAVYNQLLIGRSALLFGPERTGLENADISLADAITTIPVSDVYNSLNLAQAVSILAYEYFTYNQEQSAPTLDYGQSAPASKAEIEGLLAHLEESLLATNFFQVPEKQKKMGHNIRNIFIRSQLSDQDVRTLRGIIRALSSPQNPA